MIDEGEFWRLVKALGPERDDFDRLVERLARRSEADIVGFEDRMAHLLWQLDTPAHCEAAGTPSDDGFLYVRCAVVAAGRKAYDRVLRAPAALAEFEDDEAESLLSVAEDAYERKTGLLWEHDSPFDYETGGNAAAWGAEEEDEPDADAAPPSWLTLTFGSAMRGELPQGYLILQDEVVEAVAADPAWRLWWAGAGVPECELSLLLDDMGTDEPGATVKKGRVRARVHVTREPGVFPPSAAGLLDRATGDVRDLLGVARERLGLGELPPMPVVPVAGREDELLRPAESEPSLPPELVERLISGERMDPEEIVAWIVRDGAAER
ncbi:hypothetical protein Ade02nite_93610 [Paractinoplanes deccanensis]|uniref:DUF4240 domain-containing protein n=1 Tax=Paractinoplanes deccanensis TaxID=113561 RepID=A0ABQ3YL43_9ACTN|nr:DUF4240 domain-containing protein [Actinoplanes deccanensis]GID80720.1 hypothetical protein Ade02nite_93610 [Actinoplanes deccanensis]